MSLITHILASTLDLQVWRIVMKTEELLGFEFCSDLKLDDIFSLFNLVGANYQSTAILSVFDFMSLGIILRHCQCQLLALVRGCH